MDTPIDGRGKNWISWDRAIVCPVCQSLAGRFSLRAVPEDASMWQWIPRSHSVGVMIFQCKDACVLHVRLPIWSIIQSWLVDGTAQPPYCQPIALHNTIFVYDKYYKDFLMSCPWMNPEAEDWFMAWYREKYKEWKRNRGVDKPCITFSRC